MATELPSETVRNQERRTKYREADVVVVGAGIFGCPAAYAFANQGRSVLLLERWMHEPDRIVGELLQPGGIAALRTLGLQDCVEGIDAIPCHGYRVQYHGEDVVMEYPALGPDGQVRATTRRNLPSHEYVEQRRGQHQLNGSTKGREANGVAQGEGVNGTSGDGDDVRGRAAQGRSFHHGRFVMKLRQACLDHPNITVVETDVTKTIRGQHSDEVLGVESRTTDKETGEKRPDYFFGQLTVIADGYQSRFREQIIGKKPATRSKFYGLELIDCPLSPRGFGHVVIGKGSPVLLYQIGARETRALIDVPGDLPEASAAAGGVRAYIRDVVVPSLPEAVRPSVLAALADGKIPKSMPNSWLPPTKQVRHAGVILLGDAMNMRHPLTGGGMTVALHDVVLLTDLLRPDRVPSLADAASVRAAMDAFHRRRRSLTSIINVLAQALYSLFAARDDRHLRALQRGCFDYFRRGYTDDPLGLMGGLLHRPDVLFRHFFTVAFLSIWLRTLELCGGSILGLWTLPFALVEGVLILWRASVVFLPVFWKELR